MSDPLPTPGGQSVDDGKAHVFPCEGCGADLTFDIEVQTLKCPYCGFVKEIVEADDEVEEQDFEAMLARLEGQRIEKVAAERPDEEKLNEVRCDSCGGTVQFTGTLTSSECAYCGSPIQREGVHEATDLIPVEGMLAFRIERETARENLKQWVKSRWFLPNDLKKRGVSGKFQGVYLPYWTYDSLTSNRYTGERGEHYWVTVGSGKNKTRQRRTRWYPAAGSFRRFFDDVMVVAGAGLPAHLMDRLEPWPLQELVPFQKALLAGHLARTYDVTLADGFEVGRQKMAEELEADVRRRIGGDTQRIHSIHTHHGAITFKHLLLPVWLLAYRFKEKPYQVTVNGATGEVQGDRPWSWVKIVLLVLAVGVVGVGVYFLVEG